MAFDFLWKVLRDGRWSEQDASILVPGDVVSVKLGDIIPADARLLDGDPLKIDQVGNLISYSPLPCTHQVAIVYHCIKFGFGLCSLRLQVNLSLSRKVLVMVCTLVPLVSKERLKLWSLLLVSTPFLVKLLILLTPPTKWDTSKRQEDYLIT